MDLPREAIGPLVFLLECFLHFWGVPKESPHEI